MNSGMDSELPERERERVDPRYARQKGQGGFEFWPRCSKVPANHIIPNTLDALISTSTSDYLEFLNSSMLARVYRLA